MALTCHKSERSISLATTVWATYTTVDGIKYVSSLSGSPTPGTRLAWDSISLSGAQHLYVSSDHLGIRQIVTDTALAQVNESAPVYWKTLSIESQRLSFTDDGYKLREVSIPSLVHWSRPMSPSILGSLAFYYAGWGEGEVIARMKTLTFNQDCTVGYSVCWSGNEMISIHANRTTQEAIKYNAASDEHSEYNEYSNFKWTYHPVEQGEYIQQVWLRGSTKYDTSSALPCRGEGSLGFHLSTPWGIQKYKRPSDIALAAVDNIWKLPGSPWKEYSLLKTPRVADDR
ncbi:hypothetical protein ACHAPD_007591 [Fusarium lateritium]